MTEILGYYHGVDIINIDEIQDEPLDHHSALFAREAFLDFRVSWDISTPISPALYRIFTGERLNRSRRRKWVRWDRQQRKAARDEYRAAQRRAIGIRDGKAGA